MNRDGISGMKNFSTWVKGICIMTNEPAIDVRAEKRRELDGKIFLE